MRLRSLDLLAFGPFTDKRLDFTRPERALHVIFGPNEAGKSSTLRALIALLYGVPVRTQDAHLHGMTKLRIGAELSDDQGRSIQVVRRKGTRHTLLGPDGKPVPESTLKSLLGGLDATWYGQMFGLNHERLRQGAEALLEGRGDVGEGLFDAGAGTRSIGALVGQLRGEAEELYKPRGRTPSLNAALEALRTASKQAKQAELSPSVYAEQKEALAEARARRAKLGEERHQRLAEKSRVVRALQLLPLLRQWERVQGQLVELREGTELHDDASLSELEGRLSTLERRLGRVQKAEDEAPLLVRQRDELARREQALRSRLGAGFSLTVIDTPARVRLREGFERDADLRRSALEVERTLEELEVETERLSARALEAEPEGTREALSQLVREHESEDFSARLGRLSLDLGRLLLAQNSALGRLGIHPESPTLRQLTLPGDADLLALEREFAEQDKREDRLAARVAEGRQKAQQLEAEQATLVAQGAVLTSAEVQKARDARDALLSAVLGARAEGGDAFARASLAYQKAALTADELADQRFADAQRLLELNRIEQELRACARVLSDAHEAARELAARREALSGELRALLAATGLSASHPREVRGKLQVLAQCVEREESLAQLRLEQVARERAAHAWVKRAAAQLGLETPAEGAPCDAVKSLGVQLRAALDRTLEAARERAMLTARRAELAAKLELSIKRQKRIQAERADFAQSFARELGRLGFPAELSPSEALSCIDAASELCDVGERIAQISSQLEQREVEAAELRADVASVAARYLPNVAELGASELLSALTRRVREGLAGRRDEKRLRAELRKLEDDLLSLGDGEAVEALHASLAGLDMDVLRARRTEVEAELDTLEVGIADSDQEIGRLELGLDQLGRSRGASVPNEEVEAALAKARGLAARYLVLRLAQSMVERQVERYRAEHQDPLVARASALFPRLTLGRYEGLAVDYDSADRPVLCCQLPGDKRVHVDGLSDGTRDQLYLALRVASIERFVQQNGPMPVVLDDAFIHFDDGRAGAALAVLGELSTQTQVLFFTHHARMLELAEKVLPSQRLAVHFLKPAERPPAPRDDGPLFSRA